MLFYGVLFVLASVVRVHVSATRGPADKYFKEFQKPCFESDKPVDLRRNVGKNQNENNRNNLGIKRLVKLNGVKTGHVQEVDLGSSRNYSLITRAMKPLIFEIPDFLSSEECEHIIKLARKSGLTSSVAGFDQTAYDGDLEQELTSIDKNAPVPAQFSFMTSFSVWDRNSDGLIDKQEIGYFTAKYALLHFGEEELKDMFHQIGFKGFQNGQITRESLKSLNIAKFVKYLEFTKNKHPRYRARFSEQTWMTKDTGKHDPVMLSLNERVVKLTKLPREIIENSEDLQVVHYGPIGHYHVHYDSTQIDDQNRNRPCCRQQHSQGCRLCRFITILYYLNDVEQGGETAFVVADNTTLNTTNLLKTTSTSLEDYLNLSLNCHKANLVVAPRKGHAIMWYNHFIDEDTGLLGEVDEYSMHEGCDVIKGEKWIANNWIIGLPSGSL
ncbi:transmembrane prolyl 4-hydroxylase-like [Actinia tenebrosa]|uniref:Transmembrane prolyl 4-hydroxylase-like n=1 Tax=Actinia tenebrosa TaxID=6105 RepID=A0A6P8HJI4_ACTTE|nr:transmembrane prolyl 4-hydroxylase-like [Actinia tenebrosa]